MYQKLSNIVNKQLQSEKSKNRQLLNLTKKLLIIRILFQQFINECKIILISQ
jgi:hypothetical protein